MFHKLAVISCYFISDLVNRFDTFAARTGLNCQGLETSAPTTVSVLYTTLHYTISSYNTLHSTYTTLGLYAVLTAEQ
jgi:hypothetical protein